MLGVLGVYSRKKPQWLVRIRRCKGLPVTFKSRSKGGRESRSPRAPSVISFNGLVAALMVQRMLSTSLVFLPEGSMDNNDTMSN